MSEKVYVAASFEQSKQVKEVHKLLKEAGHDITADWTTHLELAKIMNEKDRNSLRNQYVIEDVDGVIGATTYILLLGNRKSTGAHIELGIAIGAKLKHIILVGEADQDQIFYAHPSITIVPNIAAALQLIKD